MLDSLVDHRFGKQRLNELVNVIIGFVVGVLLILVIEAHIARSLMPQLKSILVFLTHPSENQQGLLAFPDVFVIVPDICGGAVNR
jgi:hypothetical protein